MARRMHIVSGPYVAVGPGGGEIPYSGARLHLYELVDYGAYLMECACGLASHFPVVNFVMGLPHNGGRHPVENCVSVEFGAFHRWIALHCGKCGRSQRYEKVYGREPLWRQAMSAHNGDKDDGAYDVFRLSGRDIATGHSHSIHDKEGGEGDKGFPRRENPAPAGGTSRSLPQSC